MSDVLTREMLHWIREEGAGASRGAQLMRNALQRIYSLEEQVAERDKQMELWEIAAQRWATQVDDLCRKLDAPPPMRKRVGWW